LKKYENQFLDYYDGLYLIIIYGMPHLRFEHKGLLIFDQDKNIIIEKHNEQPL